jgi:hypothetical protein
MLKNELGIALPKAGKFEVITRERLADLQNEGKFQAKDIVEPGTEVKKVQIVGVQGMIRGRFYYQPPNLTIYAEIAYLDEGEVRKVKVVVPASEVAARIWPSDARRGPSVSTFRFKKRVQVTSNRDAKHGPSRLS